MYKLICSLTAFVFLLCLVFVFPASAEEPEQALKPVYLGKSIEVVNSRVYFYGGAAGNLTRSSCDASTRAFKVIYTAQTNWGSAGVNLLSPIDISKFKYMIVRARGTNKAKFIINFRSQDWRVYDLVQAGTTAIPQKGLASDWQNVVIDIENDIGMKAGGLDRSKISHLAFEVGKATAGNKKGTEITIDGIFFSNDLPRPEK